VIGTSGGRYALPGAATSDGSASPGSSQEAKPLPALPIAVVAIALFTLSMVLFSGGTLNADGFVTVQGWTRAIPDTAWSMITICGTGVAAFALLSPTLAWRPRWMAAAIAAAPFAATFSRVLKHLVALPRPAAVLDATHIHVIGATLRVNSFPSGHAVTAFTLVAVLLFASRKPIVTALWALPLATLILISRIAVGAHWPADLAIGAAGGWISGALGVAIVARWRAWNTPSGIRIMALIVIAIGVTLFAVDLGYPLATPLQYAIGALACAAGSIAWMRPRLDPQLPLNAGGSLVARP
jgi:undecaprenyl-diphosphatase